MREKFKNQYKIASIRAPWWDYGWSGAYFITICTKNRRHYLGEIKNKQMILSQVGVLADVFWHETPKHSKHTELGAFVIMPNHMHGLLIIDAPYPVLVDAKAIAGSGPGVSAETRQALSQQPTEPEKIPGKYQFQNQGKNTVSAIVGSYKSAVTRHAHRLGYEFAWQSNFYEHIVRTDADYQRIHRYIENNPARWESDIFCLSKV